MELVKEQPLIFVVDDDPISTYIMEYNLQIEDYNNICSYHSGEDCLKNIAKNPALVILDYNMEGMNGIEVLQKIKEFNPSIDVIFCSGVDDDSVASESIKYGAAIFLNKDEEGYNRIRFIAKSLIE